QIWGGGALDQSGWQAALNLTVRLALCLVGAALLYRPLSLFDAGDATVRNLGVAVGWMRGAALFVAVALTAFVVAEVGVIGFIGLAAPLLARLAGVQIWGGGALDQSGWQAALNLTVRLALCLVGAALLYRPLSLFDA
ncbi:iron chelate uptake ABC transporter family permease subunit, partial [Paraburkholderia sp. Ac-20347]|uniref:iron chelate uptake ABC transporter family permease subunit n=1 Tax=Paraburkholderia sp. Ac-20347 TaxID=2703892 RepID=UPI00197FFB2B